MSIILVTSFSEVFYKFSNSIKINKVINSWLKSWRVSKHVQTEKLVFFWEFGSHAPIPHVHIFCKSIQRTFHTAKCERSNDGESCLVDFPTFFNLNFIACKWLILFYFILLDSLYLSFYFSFSKEIRPLTSPIWPFFLLTSHIVGGCKLPVIIRNKFEITLSKVEILDTNLLRIKSNNWRTKKYG